MNKKVILGIVVLIVAVFAWWSSDSMPVSAPTDATLAEGEFSSELSGLDQVDLEADLNALDADLNAL